MPQKFNRKKIFIGLICLVGLISLVGFFGFIKPKIKPSFWWSILFSNPLKQTDGLTNFLFLGVAGGDFPGADLTDTMIFLSFNQKTDRAVLVSLPRDLWSDEMVAKINSAYHYGEEKNKGGGFTLAKTTIEKIVGLPIHYVVKIDLAGLDDVVDSLGGVEVTIDRAFDDYQFPIEGKEDDLCGGDPKYKCRYQHIHFDAGLQVLNGKLALEYVRSRNAEGDEGTDFARSKRQEKLILAMKKKIFSWQFFLHPERAIKFAQMLSRIIETDVPKEELPFLVKMAVKTNFGQMKTLGIEQFLMTPPTFQYQGQWVLVPKNNNFKEIQDYLKQQTK